MQTSISADSLVYIHSNFFYCLLFVLYQDTLYKKPPRPVLSRLLFLCQETSKHPRNISRRPKSYPTFFVFIPTLIHKLSIVAGCSLSGLYQSPVPTTSIILPTVYVISNGSRSQSSSSHPLCRRCSAGRERPRMSWRTCLVLLPLRCKMDVRCHRLALPGLRSKALR